LDDEAKTMAPLTRRRAAFGTVVMVALYGALSISLLETTACAPSAPPSTGPAAASPAAQGAQPTVAASATTFSGSDENLSPEQLETLVSRVALYPDDLLALVLPASTQPLQIVEAARLLEKRKTDPKLQPPKTWDPSVVGLLNYPEVVALMNSDLTWTQQLGTSVITQQAAVMDAIQSFRRNVYEAGNLKSDDKQKVTVEGQTVVIQPADPQVVYVPSYNPQTVVYAYPPPYYIYSPPYPYYYQSCRSLLHRRRVWSDTRLRALLDASRRLQWRRQHQPDQQHQRQPRERLALGSHFGEPGANERSGRRSRTGRGSAKLSGHP
jgi:hypothetical protein